MLELADLLWYHWLFLVAVGTLLVAGPIGIYLLSRDVTLPDDVFVQHKSLSGRRTVFVGGSGVNQDLERAALAAWDAAALAGLATSGMGYDSRKAEELDVCIWFAPKEAFTQHSNPNFRGAAGFNTRTGGLLSRKIPLIVIHPDFREEVVEYGEPVIHEALHVLRKYAGDGQGDPAHRTKGQWASVDSGSVTWQLHARERFKHRVKKA